MTELIKNIPDYDGMGVYALVGDKTGKMYIGSSSNIHKRILLHKSMLKLGTASKKLKEAVKSGERFSVTILEKVPYGKNQFDLMGIEKQYIVKYDVINNGYNTAKTTCTPLEELLADRDSCKPTSILVPYINGIISRRSKPIYKTIQKEPPV